MPPVPIEKCQVCKFFNYCHYKHGDNGMDFSGQIEDKQGGCTKFQPVAKTCQSWEIRRILNIKP